MQWKESFSIGVQKIDDQHKRLMELVSRLEVVSENEGANAAIGQTLKSLVDYTNYHFKDEEDLMLQIGYADLQNHQQMHIELVDQVRRILLDIRAGKSISVADMIAFLSQWVLEHIEKEDKKIGLQMTRLKDAANQSDQHVIDVDISPTHELRANIEQLQSFLGKKLISPQDFEAKKKELLDKFVGCFEPASYVAVIEEFKSIDALKDDALITEDDIGRIRPKLSKKIDMSLMFSEEESMEDSLSRLNHLLEEQIITESVHKTCKKEILARMA